MIDKGDSLGKLGYNLEALAGLDQCMEALSVTMAGQDQRQALIYRALAQSKKATCLVRLGRFAAAVECSDAALPHLEESIPHAWALRGLALHYLGRHGEALVSAEKALLLDPLDADSWGTKGVILGATFQIAGALECFDRARTLDPEAASIGMTRESFGKSRSKGRSAGLL